MSRDHSQNQYGPNASFDGYDSDLASAGILIESLRQQLAAALTAIKVKDEALLAAKGMIAHPDNVAIIERGIAIQPDDSALQAYVAKAGEKMRERSINEAWNNEPDCNGPIETAISSLPIVTLEDLK